MKYILFLFFLIFFLISCKSYKAYFNQCFTEKLENEYKFKFKDNKILFNVYDDSLNRYELLFDTGCSKTIIFDKKILSNLNIFGERSIKLPNKKTKLIVKRAVSNLDYGFLKIKNNSIFYEEKKYTKCRNNSLQGIIGMEIFSFLGSDTSKYILNLKFSDTTLSLFDNLKNIKSLDNYQKLSSTFYLNKHPNIFLKIDGFEDSIKFLFDTGFDYSMIINEKKVFNELTKDSLVSYDKLNIVESEKIKKNKVKTFTMFKSILMLDTLKKTTIPIIYNSDFKGNYIGIEFIKKYDWIIDFKNKQVYFKPNNIEHNLQNIYSWMYKLDYTLDVKDDKLYINQVNEKFTKYKLGAIIKSVNGIEVTPKNICELKNQVYADLENVKLEFDGSFLEENK